MIKKWETPYCTTDNFFEEKDFNELQKIINEIKFPTKFTRNVITFSKRSKDIPQNLLELLLRLENKYEEKAKNILSIIYPYKVKLHDTTRFTIAITPAGNSYPVHEDSIEKILTGVIYLKPDNNFGTYLYKSKKDTNPIELKWAKNRGFFFSREHNKTWHSYKSDTNSPRYTCVIVLSTNKIAKHILQQVGIIKFPYCYFKKVIISKIYHFYKKIFKFK